MSELEEMSGLVSSSTAAADDEEASATAKPRLLPHPNASLAPTPLQVRGTSFGHRLGGGGGALMDSSLCF